MPAGLSPAPCIRPEVLPFVNMDSLPPINSLSGTSVFFYEQRPGQPAVTIFSNTSLLPRLTSGCSVYIDDLPVMTDDFTHIQILYVCESNARYPIVFAALADRQSDTCIRFWQLLLKHFTCFIDRFVPAEISCDSDPKLIKFLTITFPTTRICGSQYRLTRRLIAELRTLQQYTNQSPSDRVLEFVQHMLELRSLPFLSIPIRYSQLRLQFASLFECPHFARFETFVQNLMVDPNNHLPPGFWAPSAILDRFHPSIDVLEAQKVIFTQISTNLRYEHSLQVLITLIDQVWNPERKLSSESNMISLSV